MRIILVSIFALLVQKFAFADDLVRPVVGQVAYAGNGCPAGSASVVLSPDATQLNILFDSFIAKAGQQNPLVVRSSCNISVPVSVPQGYTVSVSRFSIGGYAKIPMSGLGKIDVTVSQAGGPISRYAKILTVPTDDNWEMTPLDSSSERIWSPCGNDFMQRISISALAKGTQEAEALVVVDAPDLGASLQLMWKRCE